MPVERDMNYIKAASYLLGHGALALLIAGTVAVGAAVSADSTACDRFESSETHSSKLRELKMKRVRVDEKSGIHEYKLESNGLRVLLIEQHTAPVVTTTMVFHVGSRNEAVGHTGATHFLEHLMFKGSKRFDPQEKRGFDDLLKAVGGINNATTWYDRTNYYEVVPSEHLELCLELESDRMRNLLLRESDRQAEMTVVRNELERGEDEPDELLETNLFAMAFREHPYHHPVIGWRKDVEGVPISRLKEFYDRFYWPDNATLIIIGDFQKDKALHLVNKYFGSIPSSGQEAPSVYTVEPPQEGERRFVVRRGQELPRAIVGFHGPACDSADTYALDLIELILGDSARVSSRLYRSLIETGLASSVSSSNYSLKDPGLFVVSAQASLRSNPLELERVLLDEIERLRFELVSDKELERAKRSIARSHRLATADPLRYSSYLTEAISAVDWSWFVEYPDRSASVNAETIRRVARKYFTPDNRTVGHYYPKSQVPDGYQTRWKGKKLPLEEEVTNLEITGSKEIEKNTEKKVELGKKAELEKNAPSSKDTNKSFSAESKKTDRPLIAGRVKELVLDNGLRIQILPIEGCGIVALSGKLHAGSGFCPPEKSQIAYLVAETLARGTKNFSKEQIASELESMGTDLDFTANTFWTEFDSEVVVEDLPRLFEILADILRRPLFLQKEINLEKKLRSADLKESLTDTGDLSWNKLAGALYTPDSPHYEKPIEEQITELDTIKRRDLQNFHQRYYSPSRTTLSFVGDIDADEISLLASLYLNEWSGGTDESIAISAQQARKIETPSLIEVDIPDKANVDIVMGRVVDLSIKSKDYLAAQLANAALGYDSFATRLAPLRDVHGLTYGIYSNLDDPTHPYGTWTIKLSVNPENLDKARELVEQIVRKYQAEGISEEELAKEKAHLSGVFSVHLRSARHIANRLTLYDICDLKPDYIDNYAARIDSVTKDEVDQAIRRYFDMNSVVTSLAGSLNKKESSNRAINK